MSEQNPYVKLEVPEDASFEEIQSARDRLVERHPNDERARQEIEAAYDAILMDRLRKRQEGKITVPEGIRFAEKLAEKSSKTATLAKVPESPAWLQQTLDRPSVTEVLVSAGFFTTLGTIAVLNPGSNPNKPEDSLAFLVALGVGFTMYWLNRKEQRLGRAFLLTIGTLIFGGLLTVFLLQFVPPVGLPSTTLVTLAILFLFWLVSSFLR
ncbi:CPP1-like family protein [Altericista sp. CCNU0014]|uniref:CPP1-like family protein n=1 Tax=Altericista sp. CCNU0014 TaxID=3082949 RepID=UPI00384B811E